MDINLIYAVLGVLATIIVGYWGVKYSSKNQVKTSLLFFENGCLSLFKNVVKELEELEISYKGKRIDENLLVYKGTIFNSGNTDIDKSTIHQPLTVILPDYFEWKQVKIIDQSSDINIEYTFNNRELTFNWDIVKEKEYFTFDSVVEYNPKTQNENDKTDDEESNKNYDISRMLSRKVEFKHRITNLKSVDKERFPSKPSGNFEFLIMSLYLVGLFFLGLYWSVGQFVFPDYAVHYEVAIDSSYVYSPIQVESKDLLSVIDSLGNERVLNVSTLTNGALTGKVKTLKDELNYWGLIGGGLFALIMLIATIASISSHFEQKSMYKKVKNIASKYDNSDFSNFSRRMSPFLLDT